MTSPWNVCEWTGEGYWLEVVPNEALLSSVTPAKTAKRSTIMSTGTQGFPSLLMSTRQGAGVFSTWEEFS